MPPPPSATAAAPLAAYAELWDRLYDRDSQREAGSLRLRAIEWHADFPCLWPVLQPYLPVPATHAVDVGCGTSTLSLQLLAAGAVQRLTLLDASPTVVQQLQHDHAHNPRVTVLSGDCRCIPLPDQSCDLLLGKPLAHARPRAHLGIPLPSPGPHGHRCFGDLLLWQTKARWTRWTPRQSGAR